MPTYTYICHDCRTTHDTFHHSYKDRNKERCPGCNRKVEIKLQGNFAINSFKPRMEISPRTGKPVPIENREQYVSFLKKNGLHAEGYTHLTTSSEHGDKVIDEKEDEKALKIYRKKAAKKLHDDRAITLQTR